VVHHLLEEIDGRLPHGRAGIDRVRLLLHDHARRAGQPDVLQLLAELLIARLIRAEGGDLDAVVAPGLDLFEKGVVGLADIRAP
jgi:hypothetical protein